MSVGHQKDKNKLINNITNLAQSNGQQHVLLTPNEGIKPQRASMETGGGEDSLFNLRNDNPVYIKLGD